MSWTLSCRPSERASRCTTHELRRDALPRSGGRLRTDEPAAFDPCRCHLACRTGADALNVERLPCTAPAARRGWCAPHANRGAARLSELRTCPRPGGGRTVP